jgi:Macrocin-O-methyltransferase (TylF)
MNILLRKFNSLKTRIVMYLLKPTLDLYFLGKSKDIMYSLQLSALKSTAEFVKKNLRGVPTFKNKYALLVHAVKSIPESRSNDLICEFGVFSGKTINCMADQVPNRSLHGFDSFEGIPAGWNFLDRGHFKVSSLPSVGKNVTLIKGWFDETLPKFLADHSQDVALLHIDSDLYSSAKTIFELLGPRIGAGTVIVFDEFFNYPFWDEGEYKAFNEFVSEHQVKFEYLGFCTHSEQLAVRIVENGSK